MGLHAKGNHKIEEHFRGIARATVQLGRLHDALHVMIFLNFLPFLFFVLKIFISWIPIGGLEWEFQLVPNFSLKGCNLLCFLDNLVFLKLDYV